MSDLPDWIANAVMGRSESWHHYLTSAGYKMHVETLGPVLAEVRTELEALGMPPWQVEQCLSRILDRLLTRMDANAREGAERMRVALEQLRLGQ